MDYDILFFNIAILTKNFIFSQGILDFQLTLSSILLCITTWINTSSADSETKSVAKFFGHIIFLSLCFSIICSLISTLFSVLFYFGFANTIIILNIACMILFSGITNWMKVTIIKILSEYNIGNKILDLTNHYYDEYFEQRKYHEVITSSLVTLVTGYICKYSRVLYAQIIRINTTLNDNTQSKIIYEQICDRLNYLKLCIIAKILKSLFQGVPDMNMDFDCQYKNRTQNDTMDIMDMSFLQNVETKNKMQNAMMNMNFLQNVNDDLDEDDDIFGEMNSRRTNVEIKDETKSNNKDDIKNNFNDDIKNSFNDDIKNSSKDSIKNSPKDDDGSKDTLKNTSKTTEQNHTKLRNKMKEKKINRIKKNQRTENNLFDKEKMDQVFNMMMKGDNFGKIMKEMQTSNQTPNIDQEKIKQLIQSMNRKK